MKKAAPKSKRVSGGGDDVPREIPIQFTEEKNERDVMKETDKKGNLAVAPEEDAEAKTLRYIEEVEDPEVEVIYDSEPIDAPVEAAPVEEPRAGVDAFAPELQEQVETLTQEKSALYDQLLRRQAEFDNFRKRTEREKVDIYGRARADVVLELLPVIDNFERAVASLNQGADASGLRHGVELIHKQFNDALTRLGLQAIEAVGATFDPHLHEAVVLEPTDKYEENAVIEEFERGYKIGDRLLRPAKVKVASKP